MYYKTSKSIINIIPCNFSQPHTYQSVMCVLYLDLNTVIFTKI